MAHDDGDLTLNTGGQALKGWTDIEVIRGIEVFPNVFNIGMTEKFAENSTQIVVNPGDECTVKLGSDLVLTGYVDRVRPAFRKDAHSIQVVGRSKSQDMVDCSAEWKNSQITGSSALEIATKLAKPYGIKVEGETDVGPVIPSFLLNITETSAAIIERIARYRALLVYDLPNGNITLARAGSKSMASGIVEGENLQDGEAEYSMDGRFSIYEGFIMATDPYREAGDGGNLLGTEKDPNVKRNRIRTIVAEDGAQGLEQVKPRLKWEAARRFGRSFMVTATVDSWRDNSGKLWEPNALIPIQSPTLKVPQTDWLISQVIFRRNKRSGTTATITAMPKNAFLPEPIILLQAGILREVAQL